MNEDKGSIIFYKKVGSENKYHKTSIEVRTDDLDINLPDLFDMFVDFAKGCGYNAESLEKAEW